jgi:anti-sigma factor (TIGR02949 family)
MPRNERTDCEWVEERIELYLDGEVAQDEASAIEQHADRCSACAAEIDLARSITSELRALPSHKAPADIVERAEAAARAAAASSSPSLRERAVASLGAWVRGHFEGMMRPAMAAMLIVVIAAGAFVISQRDRVPTAQGDYTDAEIAAAAQQARVAFAYVGRYSREPVTVLRGDVMADRVVPRMGQAMTESLDDVMEEALVPAVEEAVMQTLFVEIKPRMVPSNP